MGEVSQGYFLEGLREDATNRGTGNDDDLPQVLCRAHDVGRVVLGGENGRDERELGGLGLRWSVASHLFGGSAYKGNDETGGHGAIAAPAVHDYRRHIASLQGLCAAQPGKGLASHRPTPHVAVMFLLPVCCIYAAMSALSRLPARPPACRPRSTFIAARERCSCTREPSWEEQRGPRAIVDALEPWRLPLAAIVCNQAPLRR